MGAGMAEGDDIGGGWDSYASHHCDRHEHFGK